MIDINKIMLDLGILTESEPFTQEQKKELHDLIDLVDTGSLGLSISPLKAIKLIHNAEKTMDAYEQKYLSFGGSTEKLKDLENKIVNDIKNDIPGHKTLTEIKNIIARR